MRQYALYLPIALLMLLAASSANAASDVQTLRMLLVERLVLMEQVAAYKWNTKRPVDDPVREANVVKAAIARSRAAGLKPEAARRFIVAQMEAAKIVQRYYVAQWEKQGVGSIAAVPDLVDELRPRIGALSVELVSLLAMSQASLGECSAFAVLQPTPPELNPVPQAWTMAVGGIVDASANCS